MGNLACLLTKQEEVLKDFDKFEIEVVLHEHGILIATILAEPTIIVEIKQKQREDEFLKKIINEFERSPRPGFDVENEVLKFQNRFCVPNISDLKKRIQHCQRVKAEHQKLTGLLQSLSIPEWQWEHITMDVIVGLPQILRDMNYIWVIVDRLAKSAHFLPIRTTYDAYRLATIYIDEIVRLHGIPVFIVSDRNMKFVSRFWRSP
ncbi:uncharacterized protein LOC114284563 [Camellia sinensis]|uniref:uncharacterized protein LOC114284563 n=1 Tax=Camellia sinensis TaxID=4442 RepID=UPI0010368B67|nr:uncharacterized protein LOC114284563 [Camellia sinensis]